MLRLDLALAATVALIAAIAQPASAAVAPAETTRPSTTALAAAATATTATTPTTTATTGGDVTLQVLAVRVARSSSNAQGMQKRFGQRYYNDGSPGVTMQMIFTLNGGGGGAGDGETAAFLPLGRDPVVLDTLIDDTYENLLVGPIENRSFAQPPAVSSDGRQVLFTIMSARAPADDAGRVYVRGALNARVARGKETVSTAALRLRAGEQVQVGPFRAILRSIADAEQNIALSLTVRGEDANRIRRMRLLSKEGRRLNSAPGDREERVENAGQAEASTSFNAIVPAGHDEVTLEFTHAEKLQSVRIPFETQIDIGQTKAGPVQVLERGGIAGGGGGAGAGANDGAGNTKTLHERPWPPPPLQVGSTNVEMPARNGSFDLATRPTTAPADQARLERASVDLFALTFSKSAPGEVEGVKWHNPPPRAFAASGYTLVRLMLSTPDVSIASVAQDGVTVTRFEDDKGKLDSTIYRDTLNRSDRALVSPDGQQALVHVTLAAAPHPGATRCTFAGTVTAKVAIRERTDAGEPVALQKGERSKIGPIIVHFADVRQEGMTSPVAAARPAYDVSLIVNGPLNTVRSIEVVNAENGRRLVSRNLFGNYDENRVVYGNSVSFTIPLTEHPPEKVIVRVRHFEKLDTITVPFEVTTGVGL